MNFKRHDVQEFIEFNLGCLEVSRWKEYLPSLLSLNVDESIKKKLDNCIESDTYSYLYKSIYTFTQALSNISRRNFNWGIVQLYYSCFYAIRTEILLSNHCIVRCKGLYMVENLIGRKFFQIKFNNITGDHQMAIALLKKLKKEQLIMDEILDTELEGDDAYTWLRKHRERSNYQLKNFSDPETDEIFSHIDQYFKSNEVFELLYFYQTSSYEVCFDIDHSIIAIPFKKIQQVKNKINDKYGFNIWENYKHYLYIRNQLHSLGFDKNKIKQFI